MIKYMFGLMAEDFDLAGARVMVYLPESIVANNTGARRVSRTATLDGEVELYDTGYAAADKTLNLITDIGHLDFLTRLVKNYTEILVSTDEGLFRGCPRSWRVTGGNAEIEILVSEGL